MASLVSVIIPTKNSARTLHACIQSVKQQSYDAVEIIVVDNSSSDTTLEIANYHNIPAVQAGNERSAQRNAGAALGNGEYILFIDSDMELSENVIEQCMATMQTMPSAHALLIPEQSFGKGFWASCKAFERSCYIHIPWMQAARFFRKSSYAAVGGFDETMIAGEDFDIHHRIIRTFGNSSIADISAYILHNEGNLTLSGLMKKKFYYGKHIGTYRNKRHNTNEYKKQSSLISRIALFSSNPKRIIAHPLLFAGTIVMKTAEFISGGLGHSIGIKIAVQ